MAGRLEPLTIMVADEEANGYRFTEQDLVGIAEEFTERGIPAAVPIKLGHNSKQPLTDGQPRLGTIEKLWVSGKKLMAAAVDVPGVILESIRAGLYRSVSVELLKGVTRNGRKYAYALDAVAILGADIPAFETLGDLKKLLATRQPGDSRARLAFSGADVRVREDDSEMIELKRELATIKAERETTKVRAHRAELKRVHDDMVRAGTITSGQRNATEALLQFSDDAAVMRVKVEDLQQFARAPRPGGRVAFAADRSVDGTARDPAASEHPGALLGDKLTAEIERVGVKVDPESGMVTQFNAESAVQFARKNRALVRAWMDSIGGK